MGTTTFNATIEYNQYSKSWWANVRGTTHSSRGVGSASTPEIVAQGIEAFLRNCSICKECESPYEWNYSTKDKGYCFTCDFWRQRLYYHKLIKNRLKSFIINGTAYMDGGASSEPRKWLGFGGAKFKIQMRHTKEIIETNNLWCQGDVPQNMLHYFPDNAEFIQ